jgi:hypothetical protein
MLAEIHIAGAPTVPIPNGWNRLEPKISSGGFSTSCTGSWPGPSEPSPTWTFPAEFTTSGSCLATAAWIAARDRRVGGQPNPPSTCITAPSVTTARPGDVLVGLFGIAMNGAIAPPPACSSGAK